MLLHFSLYNIRKNIQHGVCGEPDLSVIKMEEPQSPENEVLTNLSLSHLQPHICVLPTPSKTSKQGRNKK